MTQFSFPTEGLRRLRRGEAGGLGIAGGFDSPGLVPEAPVSASETTIAQLGEALGVIGSAAGTVGSLANRRIIQREQQLADEERQRREADRIANLQARNTEYLDNVIRGDFRRGAREALPTILDDIAERRIIVPNGETPQSVAESILEERFGEEEVGLLAAREQIAPRLIEALTDQTRIEREQARSENLRGIADEIGSGSADPAALVAQARGAHPELTDPQVYDAVIKPAAIAAAERGDPDRVNSIMDAAGEGFEIQRQALLDRAKTVQVHDEGIRQELNREQIAGTILDGNLEVAKERIEEYRTDGRISQEDANVLRNRVLAEENRLAVDNSAALERQLVETWTQTNVSQWSGLLQSAETSGGRLALPRENVVLKNPDGKVIGTITPTQAFDMALSDAMSQIERHYGSDPEQSEQKVAQQAALLAFNAAEWQPWKDVIAQAAGSMAIATRRVQEGGEAPPLPAASVEGFRLYKQLQNLSPDLLDAHMTPQARLFFEAATVAEETDARFKLRSDQGPVTAPNPEAALVKATQAIARGPSGSLDSNRLGNVIDGNATMDNWLHGSAWIIPWTEGQIDNYEDIRGKIAEKAAYLIRTGSTSSYEKAVKEAVKSVKSSHTRLNGYLVETSSALDKRVLSNVTEHLAERYVSQYGTEEGIRAKDIILAPVIGRKGLWQVVRKDGAMISPLNNSFRFLESNLLTDRQILDLAADAAASAQRRSTPPPVDPMRSEISIP